MGRAFMGSNLFTQVGVPGDCARSFKVGTESLNCSAAFLTIASTGLAYCHALCKGYILKCLRHESVDAQSAPITARR